MRVAQVVSSELLSSETLLEAVVGILGFALLAAGAGVGVAFAYRWYSAEEVPEGVAVLFGVAMVAIWLNTQSALQQAILGDTPLTDPSTAIYTVAAFTASAVAADGGRRLGDFLARDVFVVATPRTITEVSQLVRSAGRVVSVELPEEIGDIDGYDAVEESVKAELAGQTFRFPRRLTADQLRERLIARLERDYGIGHVDADLTADGTVEYLAVGSRPAGIGPTLAPGTVAVALTGDPAADASPGDAVRIWARDDEDGTARRVAGGELRATAADIATVALDAEDARDLEPEREYRLVTLPGSPDAERDLVSLLRTADETVTTVSVGTDDQLAGLSVDSLPVLVLALERDPDSSDGGDGDGGDGGDKYLPLPAGSERLAAGDIAYVLGRPDALRRVTERTLVEASDQSDEQERARETVAGGQDDREPERPQER
ncbi:potassium transporter TrkA [Natrinema versiforme]|uniref:potassium transporter TrkA n=1 Tax=Natrinema versiforme TaxID=88724 RepID=UPI0018721A08